MPNPNPIGFSIQGNTGFFAKAVQARPRVALLMDPFANVDSARYIRQQSPETFIVIRYTKGDQDYWKPANVWCEEAFAFFAPFRDAGVLDAVALLNEPHRQGKTRAEQVASLKRLNDWHVEAAAFFHARNIKVGAWSASVGEFALVGDTPDGGDWQFLHGGAAACDYAFLHEYTWLMPPTGSGYWLLRYRRMFAELPAASRKPIIITECLHDHGLVGDLGGVFRDDGRQIYGGLADLSWYADRLAEDNGQVGRPKVLGATVYGFGTVAPWGTFDWGDGEERSTALIDFMRTYVPTTAPVDPIPPVDPPPIDPPPVDPPPVDPPIDPPSQGVVTMVPFRIPQELLDAGYQAIEGTPLKDRPFFRLMWREMPAGGLSGASVVSGVSAFERVQVLDLFGRPATGMKLACRYPDGNGVVISVGVDGAQVNNGTGAAFTPPAPPPLDIFVASYDAYKDDEKPPRIHYSEIWSDHVLAGDTGGLHKENQWVFYQVPTNAAPVDFAQALRYAAYPAIRLTVPVYNPDAALQAAARARDLKAVLSDEFHIQWQGVKFVCQDFAGGIIYTEEGHYKPDEIKVLNW